MFFPQINWAGPAPGYVGSEFQLVPLLAALLYPLFGVHEWIGRGISVAFFTASLPFFFLLVRRLHTARAALAAVSVYVAIPLSIFSSRSFMPDMASLSMALAALYLFTRWLEHDGPPLVFTGVAVTLALALLVKPFIATVGFALLYLAFCKYGHGWVRTTRLWALAALAVIPSLVWYAHAYYLSISNPPFHFFGGGVVGLGALKDYAGVAAEVVFVSLTPTVVVLAAIGLFVRPRRPGGYAFHYWLIGVLLFLVTVARHAHQWYPLALVPIAAALAAQHSTGSPICWNRVGAALGDLGRTRPLPRPGGLRLYAGRAPLSAGGPSGFRGRRGVASAGAARRAGRRGRCWRPDRDLL